MQLNGKYGVGNLFRILLILFSFVCIMFLLFYIKILEVFNYSLDFFLGMVYPIGFCFLGLVYQFIKLFDSLKNNNPFCYNTVIVLKSAMIFSYIISLLLLISLIIIVFVYDYYSFGIKICVLVVSILFFGVGVALYMLKELFKQAVSYKEENDLTI